MSWRCARRVRDWILSRANSTPSKERTCENFNHRVKELSVVALLKITVALGFRSWISKGCDGSSEFVSDKNAERIGYFAREDRGMAEYHAQTPSHVGASVDNFLRNTESWEPLTPMLDTPSLNRVCSILGFVDIFFACRRHGCTDLCVACVCVWIFSCRIHFLVLEVRMKSL